MKYPIQNQTNKRLISLEFYRCEVLASYSFAPLNSSRVYKHVWAAEEKRVIFQIIVFFSNITNEYTCHSSKGLVHLHLGYAKSA